MKVENAELSERCASIEQSFKKLEDSLNQRMNQQVSFQQAQLSRMMIELQNKLDAASKLNKEMKPVKVHRMTS
jgi:hypothetical protein